MCSSRKPNNEIFRPYKSKSSDWFSNSSVIYPFSQIQSKNKHSKKIFFGIYSSASQETTVFWDTTKLDWKIVSFPTLNISLYVAITLTAVIQNKMFAVKFRYNKNIVFEIHSTFYDSEANDILKLCLSLDSSFLST